jgi:hypothetical protein
LKQSLNLNMHSSDHAILLRRLNLLERSHLNRLFHGAQELHLFSDQVPLLLSLFSASGISNWHT